MSQISNLYDNIKTRLASTFPSHSYLSHARNPEKNSEQQLSMGYGFYLGPGSNTNRQLSCQMSINRSAFVVFTRRVIATDRDKTAKDDVEKDLLEDLFDLASDFESDPAIKDDPHVAYFAYSSDEGIQTVFDNDERFIKLVAEFRFEIFDNLT